MKTSSPREYLNLIEKENFSMIYEYQLKNTTSCPAKLQRSDLIVNPRKRGRTTYKFVFSTHTHCDQSNITLEKFVSCLTNSKY